jgi:hypothetical protein
MSVVLETDTFFYDGTFKRYVKATRGQLAVMPIESLRRKAVTD